MPYVSRDSQNKVIALFREPNSSAREEVSATDPAVVRFLFENLETVATSNRNRRNSIFDLDDMRLSDLGLVRVVEDLIDILVEKRVISISDLPEAAVDRMRSRKSIRSQLEEFNRVLNDEFKHND